MSLSPPSTAAHEEDMSSNHDVITLVPEEADLRESCPLLQDTTAPPPPEAFPRSVFYIISTEFCERFTFYGIKAVLFIYLTTYLLFSDSDAMASIHAFNMFAYFFPLLGGVLSDSYLGKFKTILYLSLIYCIGNTVMAVTAIPHWTGDPPHWWGVLIGLGLLALGTGGIKPCVSAFGGDQFHPSQVHEISVFFSMFYFAINSGSVLSMILTPILRKDVQCFGRNDCFSVAFGVPAILMFLATIIMVAGKKQYVMVPPTGENLVMKVLRCCCFALKQRWKATPEERGQAIHWLEFAKPKFTPEFIQDVRSLLSVLYMFIPLPLFWTLYDQQATRWTSQAMLMGGKTGLFGFEFEIKPDQMGVTNAVGILIMIPVFEKWIYPFLSKRGFRLRPLQRMAWGMFFTGIAFVMAGFLQSQIDKTLVPKIMKQGYECTENCVPILWQVPQYIVLTAGEIMFSITGLEFAYSQAPTSMKSVCQSSWLLTVAVGNLLVVLISEMKLFEPMMELYFFSSLIFAATFVFVILACTYKYYGEVAEHGCDDESLNTTSSRGDA